MSLMPAVIALSALAGVLGLVVAAVYARNLRQVRSPFTWALFLFALVLVLQSAFAVYDDVTMMATFTPHAQLRLVIEDVLEVLALGFLTWATMR